MGVRSFCSITWGRDRCAHFFYYTRRSDISCFSNRMAPSRVRTRPRAERPCTSRPDIYMGPHVMTLPYGAYCHTNLSSLPVSCYLSYRRHIFSRHLCLPRRVVEARKEELLLLTCRGSHPLGAILCWHGEVRGHRRLLPLRDKRSLEELATVETLPRFLHCYALAQIWRLHHPPSRSTCPKMEGARFNLPIGKKILQVTDKRVYWIYQKI